MGYNFVFIIHTIQYKSMASASVVALSGLWCVFTCPILLDVEIPYYSILLHTVPYNTQWLSSSLLRSWAFGVYLLVPYYSILQPHITPYHTVQYPIAIVNLVALLGFRCVFTCPTLLHITVPYYSILLHAIPYNSHRPLSNLWRAWAFSVHSQKNTKYKNFTSPPNRLHTMSYVTLLWGGYD